MFFEQFCLESLGDASSFVGSEEDIRQHAKEPCHTLQEKILTLLATFRFILLRSRFLCDDSIGRRLSTTIGYERLMNKVLANLTSQDES